MGRGEPLAVVSQSGLGGFPQEELAKGFPGISKVANPKGDTEKLFVPVSPRPYVPASSSSSTLHSFQLHQLHQLHLGVFQ